jgi:DNA-binding MarR family transcriptional regulator
MTMHDTRLPAHPAVPEPMAPSKPTGCSSLKLRQLSRRVSQHFDRYVGEVGLKTTQYSLLSTIVLLQPVSPGDLAHQLQMDASTLTRNLQPLVAQGWASVGPGENGRSRLVTATPAGVAKRALAQRAWKRAQLALNQRLGVDTVASLHALIDADARRRRRLSARAPAQAVRVACTPGSTSSP